MHEIQKNLRVGQEIYYWRTREKDEVDFVLVQDRIPIAIEVKSRLQMPVIPEGVKKFIQKYPECKKVVVLNDDLQETIIYQGKKVIFVPNYYAYLLPFLFE